MSFLDDFQRSRSIKLALFILLCTIITIFRLAFSGDNSEPATSDGYSNEELNSILQGKTSGFAITKVPLINHALEHPYLDAQSLSGMAWSISSSAMIKNYEYIRLISDRPDNSARMFSKMPIEAESFELEVEFNLHGRANNGLMGDGWALWLTNKALGPGEVFGVENHWVGLGVVFDTYRNGKSGHFPQAGAIVGDGNQYFDNSIDGANIMMASCMARGIYNTNSGKSRARLVVLKDGYVSLDLDNKANGNWKNCFTLQDVNLPKSMYIGISGATGALSHAFDLIALHAYSLSGSDGQPIQNIAQLEQIMRPVEAEEIQGKQNLYSQPGKGGRNQKDKDSTNTRRTLKRLQMSERRIKEQVAERKKQARLEGKLGFFGRLFWLLKYTVYISLSGLVVHVGRVYYRVYKEQRRRHNRGGLIN